jgi:hypothetical protein
MICKKKKKKKFKKKKKKRNLQNELFSASNSTLFIWKREFALILSDE